MDLNKVSIMELLEPLLFGKFVYCVDVSAVMDGWVT